MKDTVFVFADLSRSGSPTPGPTSHAGPLPALRRHRLTLSRTLRALARDPRFRTIVAVTPDRAAHGMPRWAHGLAVVPQGRGDRGQRMARIAARLPLGRLAFLSGGQPGATTNDIAHAFRMLGQAHACFGPSSDGNYWLVALSPRRPAAPFALVRWSTDWALEDTLANFVGRQVALIRELEGAAPMAAPVRRRAA